ncbi:MAG: HAD-IIIA family hydrolase [Planctomycetota bacterium]|jgi:D-glycero-D-manno-heptose 1,7-bisphosphate phosphatase|nr:HAD-IIIA family hydrolase [Planctomycetota bacterium]
MTQRVVLLDRDGVLNVDLPTGVLRREDLTMEPAAAAAVARLNAAGYRVVVVTNQACVGRGELAPEELGQINAAIDAAVVAAGGQIDAWYCCVHPAEQGCACRKPAPGLIHQAQADWDFEPAATWLIGDAARDLAAAEAAGCRPLLVRTGKGRTTEAERSDIPAVDDLAAAVDLIVEGAR